MPDRQKQQRPGVNRGVVRSEQRSGGGQRGNSPTRTATQQRVPSDWRTRVPSPGDYYRARITKLGKPNAQGWAQGRCPFHEDRAASLSVDLREGSRGGWRCFAGCGKGDLVSFHQRLTGKEFLDAVRDLIGGAR